MNTPIRRTPVGTKPGKASARDFDWGNENVTQALVQRGEQSYRTKDGSQFKGILDEVMIKDVPVAKITAGRKYWDIIPYLAGPNDPEVVAGRMALGSPTHTCGVHTHKNVGPNQDRYICLAKTYGKPCPICEEYAELSRNPDADEVVIKELRPSKYMTFVYNIWDRDAESKGVQVYLLNGYHFERHIQSQAKGARTGGYIAFASPLAGPQGGRHIAVDINITGTNQDWSGHKFEIRDHAIPVNILDQAYCLDELLHVPTYEEVSEAFYGSGAAQAEYADAPGDAADPPECFRGGELYEECQECQWHVECGPPSAIEEAEPEPAPVIPPNVQRPIQRPTGPTGVAPGRPIRRKP